MRPQCNQPEALLEELIHKGGRPLKLRNLQAIHEICRAQYEVGGEISVSTIGKLCERKGLLAARGLYNAAMSDYRGLIDAWSAFAGPPVPKPTRPLASDDYLMRIEDPAIRSLVQAVIVERNKLKAQLNTLKANTTILVDRRPPVRDGALLFRALLTDSERIALIKSVSQEFFESQGWREVDFGEVVNSKGRTIFDPGFATAVRKVADT